ncbi:hypothetical protein AB0K53_28255 [Streptomyces tuirus]|uniref:hypothetical protein n=1 Tax=Streptomyces tuirus TaxID=68278 RepID=UPI00342C4761
MSLAAIAIVVASVSALFTGANMLVSYRTFKRVRPNVKVRLWRTGAQVSEHEPDSAGYLFILRLLNNGATPVTVERIELCRYEASWSRRRFHLVKGTRFDANGKSGKEPPVVPALDGTTYRFSVRQRSLDPKDHLRFRVLLSNGRTATSRLLPFNSWGFDSDE